MMDFVNGKDDNPYMKWKKMLETTNQIIYSQIPYIGFFVSDPYSAIQGYPVTTTIDLNLLSRIINM